MGGSRGASETPAKQRSVKYFFVYSTQSISAHSCFQELRKSWGGVFLYVGYSTMSTHYIMSSKSWLRSTTRVSSSSQKLQQTTLEVGDATPPNHNPPSIINQYNKKETETSSSQLTS
jgi:hypothetical protein